MKKKYIAPEIVIVDVRIGEIVAASAPVSQEKGDGKDALSNEYRSTLWN